MPRFECRDCKRREECAGPIGPRAWVEPELVKNIDLFILGEGPGDVEEREGKVFIGPAGGYLNTTLRHMAGVSWIISNCVCCYAKHKPRPTEIRECRKHWEALVARHNPALIVALGKYASEAVLGSTVAVTKQAGEFHAIEIAGKARKVLICTHPSYVARMQDTKGGEADRAMDVWLDVWSSAKSFLSRGTPEPPKVDVLTHCGAIRSYLKTLCFQEEPIEWAYDYETYGDVDSTRPPLNRKFQVLTVGVAYKTLEWADAAAAFPLDWPGHFHGAEAQVVEDAWTDFVSKSGQAACHNSKFEHGCNIRRFGRTWPSQCTMLKRFTLDERAPLKLGSVARFCGVSWHAYKDESREMQADALAFPLKDVLRYNALDALAALNCNRVLRQRLEDENLEDVAGMQEGWAEDLAWLEAAGSKVDPDVAAKVRVKLARDRKNLIAELVKTPAVKKVLTWASGGGIKKFDGTFNPNSDPQSRHLFKDVLKLKGGTKKDASGRKYETYDKKVLEPYLKNPVVRMVVEARSLKSQDGFLEKYGQFLGPEGYIHTEYNQTMVVTGRLSSTNPPLQNIPKRSLVRTAFVSRYPDGYLIGGDYSQLEPRLLAGWSGEPRLCAALTQGLDLHAFVTCQIYDQDYDEFMARLAKHDPEVEAMRDFGKRMNLGTMYGQTEHGLAQKTGKSLKFAKEMIDRYDRQFPGIPAFRAKFHKMASALGYVVDLFGARRHLPDAMSSDRYRRERAWRQASNDPIQATGNKFTLIAVHECRNAIIQADMADKMVVFQTTHDSLVVDSAPEVFNDAARLLEESMLVHNTRRYWKDKPVPMKVDLSFGRNLLEKNPW